MNFKAHTSIIGTTGTGKTYATNRLILKERQGALYFNTNLVDLAPGWIKANGDNTFQQIVSNIKLGKKINYLPGRATREKELIYLIDNLFESNFTADRPFICAIDECHLYRKDSERKLIEIATSGRTFGFIGTFISQRPAEMNYTLLSQSSLFYLFDVNGFEENYLKGKGFPVDKIKSEIIKNGLYSYVTYDWMNVEGHIRVK
jgi:DNA helicase HerA-like ATPase